MRDAVVSNVFSNTEKSIIEKIKRELHHFLKQHETPQYIKFIKEFTAKEARGDKGIEGEIKRIIYKYFLLKNTAEIFSELRGEAEEENKEGNRFIKFRHDYLLPLSWENIQDKLTESTDNPPITLIVRIAKSFIPNLLSLAEKPRCILNRFRKHIHVSRVQQVDPVCIQWLSRQPGITPLQKAGAKQKILAVAREEYFNTLENRVLKTTIKLCAEECIEYLFLYQAKFSNHEIIKMIRKTYRRLLMLLSSPLFKKIEILNRIPKANYVLQSDPAYKELWLWYLKLIKKEQLVEYMWQYQNEYIIQLLTLYLLFSLYLLYNDEKTHKSTISALFKYNLWFHPAPVYGELFEKNEYPKFFFVNIKGNKFCVEFNYPEKRENCIIAEFIFKKIMRNNEHLLNFYDDNEFKIKIAFLDDSHILNNNNIIANSDIIIAIDKVDIPGEYNSAEVISIPEIYISNRSKQAKNYNPNEELIMEIANSIENIINSKLQSASV